MAKSPGSPRRTTAFDEETKGEGVPPVVEMRAAPPHIFTRRRVGIQSLARRPEEALQAFQEGLAFQQKLVGATPPSPTSRLSWPVLTTA